MAWAATGRFFMPYEPTPHPLDRKVSRESLASCWVDQMVTMHGVTVLKAMLKQFGTARQPECEEAMNAALLKLWTFPQHPPIERAAATWILFSKRAYIDERRVVNTRIAALEHAEHHRPTSDPFAALAHEEWVEGLLREVEALSGVHRDVLMMMLKKSPETLPAAELAAAQGISRENAQQRIQRARALLVQIIDRLDRRNS